MSDSLREQMLKAGFKEKPAAKKKPKRQAKASASAKKPGTKPHKSKHNTGPSSMERAKIAEREAIATRKRIKADIKAIIEADKIDNYKGESAHSYVAGKRIKQLFVTDDIRKQLVDGTLVITRLNGATYLIPAQTGEKVQALNPDWIVITPNSDTTTDGDDEYADYQVPDDLKW